MAEQSTYSFNDIADKKALPFIDKKSLIKKAIEKGASWQDIAQTYQLRSELMAQYDTCMGKDVFKKTDMGTYYQNDLLKNIQIVSPLNEALEENDDKLVDCILEYYPEALRMTPGLMSSVVYSKNGLSKIEACCLKNPILLKTFWDERKEDLVYVFNELTNSGELKQNEVSYENLLKMVNIYNELTEDKNPAFLLTAIRRKQPALCEGLLNQGYNPLSFADKHCTYTYYEVAYKRLLFSPYNKAYNQIIQSMRQHLPAEQKEYTEGLEKETAKKRIKQHSTTRKLIIGGVVITAVCGFMLSQCVKKINFLMQQEEKKMQSETKKTALAPVKVSDTKPVIQVAPSCHIR